MRVSVITVCFNAAETIRDTLESVAAQLHPDVEHIVVDGLSTDATLQIVSEYPHVARVVSERDCGLYDAMNKGAALATGDMIGWLNADDLLASPLALAHIARAGEGAPVVAAGVNMVDARDTALVIRRYASSSFSLKWLRYGYAVPHPGFYIRRDVLERIGGYDLRYPLAADFDLIARALHRERIPYVLLSEVVVLMRMGGRSFGVKAALRMLEEVYQSCRRNGISTNRLLMLYRYGHKALQYFGRRDPEVRSQ